MHLFKGPGRIFAVTADETGGNLPARYAPWTAFKSLEMTRGEALPGVEVDECLDDIERFGFHITDAHVRIRDQGAD